MPRNLSSIPRADHFRMPAEWEAHAQTWMLWPERGDNWREGASHAQKAFTAAATAIRQFEPVCMGVLPGQLKKARRMLPASVQVVEMNYNDSWMRDNGPTFVVDGQGNTRIIDWEFNAWGGIYTDWRLDETVPLAVADLERLDYYSAALVLEGGSFHVDGEGSLLTTEECLLNANRNPHLDRSQIETHLRNYLNADTILWLGRGVFNDETDGHVDNLCCFLRPGVVALTWTEDHDDPQYEISSDAYDRLSKARDARGRRLEIHKIHQPNPIFITAEEASGVISKAGTLPRRPGDRLAASYINFYFCNGGVIVPTFNDAHDEPALEMLQSLLPERKVIGIYAREIALGGGNIHCITQQQPSG